MCDLNENSLDPFLSRIATAALLFTNVRGLHNNNIRLMSKQKLAEYRVWNNTLHY